MYDEESLKSIQPYVVLESTKFYQHFVSKFGISHFYSFSGNSLYDSDVSFIADGCSNIIFAYSKNETKGIFIGSTVEQIPFTIQKDTEYFGVRFLPGENPCFTNLVVKTLVGKEINLKEFPLFSDLCNKMQKAGNFDSRMNTFLQEYQKLYEHEVSTQRSLYRQFIQIIIKRKGLLKISELVVLTGYSARYLNQVFENICGMSAKQFCNIVKLQFLLNDIVHSKIESFSKLASDYNFYDTAHFIHEFKAYTGATPADYFNSSRVMEYQEKVVNI